MINPRTWSTVATSSFVGVVGPTCSDEGRSGATDNVSDSDGISMGDDDDDDDDDDGNGDAGSSGGTGGCGVEALVDPVPATLMLLIDQSGSMNAGFEGQSRWEAMRATLHDPEDGLVPSYSTQIRFGQMLYSSLDGTINGGQCPIVDTVEPALDGATALAAQFDNTPDPANDTPTGASIDAAVASLMTAGFVGESAIVLATDGEPDTCSEPDPQNGQGDAVAAAERAFNAGVQLYIVSVGDEISDDHLQDMANAGMGLEVGGSELAPFYRALGGDELVAAFEEIAGGVVSCTYEISGEVDPARYCEGEVTLDGATLVCDETWTVVDGSTLRILGEACAALRDGEPHHLDAEFPCGVFEPIE